MMKLYSIFLTLIFSILPTWGADICNFPTSERRVWDWGKNYYINTCNHYASDDFNVDVVRQKSLLLIRVALSQPSSFDAKELATLTKAYNRLQSIQIEEYEPDFTNIQEGFNISDLRGYFKGNAAARYTFHIQVFGFTIHSPQDYQIQVLVHEAIHAGGEYDEILTTKLERKVIRANQIIPYSNNYIPEETDQILKTQPNFDTEKYKRYWHPANWAQFERRKCLLKLKSSTGTVTEYVGELWYGSPFVYPRSISDLELKDYIYDEAILDNYFRSPSYGRMRQNDFPQKVTVRDISTSKDKYGLWKKLEYFNVGAYRPLSGQAVIYFDSKSTSKDILIDRYEGFISEAESSNSQGYLAPVIGVSKNSGLELQRIIKNSKDKRLISVECDR